MTYSFKVEDMSCNHCKMTIEKALAQLPEIDSYSVNLENKLVSVETGADAQFVMDKIRDSGYTPELVSS
jgi:copper chaperone CopZ